MSTPRSTPAAIRRFQYGILGATALLLLIGEGTLVGARRAVHTIGRETAPSIISAQEISSALADLDANAGNYLLGNREHQMAARKTFEQRRVKVTEELIEAAHNITYGDAERIPINAMMDGLGEYLEMIGECRYRKDQGDAAGAVMRYSVASDLMHQRLLPAAEQLDAANHKILDSGYAEQNRASEGVEILAGAAGLVLFGLLGWAQWFLFRRTRRVFNLELVAASAICAVFSVYLVSRIAEAREDLRIAKVDAFESIHAAFKARSLAYDANGDETRFLLQSGAVRASFELAFRDKVAKLTNTPEPSGGVLAAQNPPDTFKGLFPDTLRNITFQGEEDAAVRIVKSFAVYHRIDGQIRALELAGKHDDAVELCIGAGAGKSTAAFDELDRSVAWLIQINKTHFDEVITSGERTLTRGMYLVPIAAALIALLTFLGIRPRLREYSA